MILSVVLVALVASFASSTMAAEKVKVLIIDGQNNHNWKKMTGPMKDTLIATGRFTVEVSTLPSNKGKPEEWAAWKPEFAKYDVIVSNYNDGGKCRWPAERRKEFEKFMSEGGGFVPVHAADNSSNDWPAYNDIIGVGGWGGRNPKSGCLMRKKDGKWAPDPAPKGKSGSHGGGWEYPINTEAPDHPIMKGIPSGWKHAAEEMYNSMRGPCKNLTVLASAPSKRTKVDEPQVMIIKYGKGTTCHITIGHVGGLAPIQCVGFQTLLARGTEFAATGKVTIAIPKEFPTKDKISVVPADKVTWGKLKTASKRPTTSIILAGVLAGMCLMAVRRG
jgi:type 1 glutamine amidotransferase